MKIVHGMYQGKKMSLPETQPEVADFGSPANHSVPSGAGPVRTQEGSFMTGNSSGIGPRSEEGDFMATKQHGRTGKSRIKR